MKTAFLKGTALDWAVAKCEEMSRLDERVTQQGVRWGGHFFEPSKNWGEGGSILAREGITISFQGAGCDWYAETSRKDPFFSCYGPTPLIAAMRCYVSSVLGDQVEVPDELI